MEIPGEVRGEKFVVHRTDEGLVWVDYAAGAEIGEADARALIDGIETVSGGVAKPMLVDMRSVRSVERSARRLFGDSKAASRVALVVGSALSRTVAGFFIGLSRPEVPTKVFNDTDAARAWLKEAE